MRVFLLLVVGCFVYVACTHLSPLRTLRRWLVPASSTKQSLSRAPDPEPQQILRDVNRYRRQHGLKPLHYSKTCQAAARIQAQYNANHGTFHHDNTELPTPGDRLREVNHQYQRTPIRWAENALRYTLNRDARHSVGWHVFHCYHISPHHDKEMLDPKATLFGTASIIDNGVLYNTEVFAN